MDWRILLPVTETVELVIEGGGAFDVGECSLTPKAERNAVRPVIVPPGQSGCPFTRREPLPALHVCCVDPRPA